MSDHEFEKQVRQKLDDLRLTPTPEAWQKIEDGIRDTRRRRAPLLWLPLLLIGLGAGGYFLMQPTPDDNRQTSNVKRETANVKRETSEVRGETANGKRETSDVRGETPSGTVILSEAKDLERQTANVKRETSDVRGETPSGTVILSEAKDLHKTPDDLASSEAQDLQKRLPISLSATKPGFSSPSAPKFAGASVASTPKVTPPLLIKKRKWSYGVTAYAGASGLNDGNLLKVKSAFNSDLQNRANVAFAPSYTPYRITAGPAFSAGVYVKRELSQRFSLSTGLNYLQMHIKYRPGAQVYNSPLNMVPPPPLSVGNFFTLDQHKSTDQRNTYQFIELPLTLHTRLTKSQRFPVYWNTGIAYTRLVSTNSKEFDGSTGIYYSNEKLINKSQFAVNTGFDFTITPRSKYPISVGPSARYNLTPLTSEGFSEKKNLISAGLNVKVGVK